MSKIVLCSLLGIVALSLGLRASAQQNVCVNCQGKNCVYTHDIGRCACAIYMNGQCSSCGLCLYGACYQGCPSRGANASSDSIDPSSKNASSLLDMPPATDQELSAHPWLDDRSLSEKLSVYSPEIGQLIANEQQNLRAHWGPEFRRGSGLLVPSDEKSAYRWELLTHKNSDEYRVIRVADKNEKRIIFTPTTWLLTSGDWDQQFVAKGDIAKP